ncbi:leucyl aminopeptidase, partial [Candidatus Margulisiibacteriota bacterium]
GINPDIAVSAIVQGSVLADYKFSGYKSKKDNSDAINELVIVDYDCEKVNKAKAAASRDQIIAEGANRARDLVNGPSNIITPSFLSERAKEIAKENKLEYESMDRKEISKKGMKLIEAVAQGSKVEPQVIVLKYNGGGKETFGLVGKGVTFDSGGISIKPSRGLWEMKTDMAGAAAVIEAMGVIAQLKLKVNIVAVVPVTENMPGAEACKPGDVIGSLSGKTVEIISTDAEGRLVLADAITYAKKLGATKIIDIATLTGGCIIALGDVAAGVIGNDQKLIDKIISLSQKSGDKVWQLPLYDDYKEYLKSDIADIKNSTDRGGKASASTGATFLREFVEDTPFVHIDIAGTALLDRTVGHMDKGATGSGVFILSYLFMELSK